MSNIIEEINEIQVHSIPDFVKAVLDFKYEGDCDDYTVYFRGEDSDYGKNAFQPSIYRKSHDLESVPRYLKNEHLIYREMQRFNNHEFIEDRSAFDKLSRMQHYLAPTRLIDFSEDALTALYFALVTRKTCDDAIVYVTAVANDKIKYYDSDAVSVISNLAKLPLDNDDISEKSKRAIAEKAKEKLHRIDDFNKCKSAEFLLHEIKEEKSYFSHIINPQHIFSAQFVKPKLTNTRIYGQKGAFLLFGLKFDDVKNHIPIINYKDKKLVLLSDSSRMKHPIIKIMKIRVSCLITLDYLKKLGVTTPYIYTGMDKVSDHLKELYK
jgi:hypothetical protein